MVSRRLDILLETLKSSVPDKHFFEIVATMTTEEWTEVVQNQETYKSLLPYLIHTYDSAKFDEVESVVGEKMGQALADAWFTVFHGGGREAEAQPTIKDLGKSPCLVPLLTGHLLKKLEGAGYNEEFGDFIREKHSYLIGDLVSYVAGATDKQIARTVYGAADNEGIFPPLSDYDTRELSNLLGYAYLLNSIQYATELLGLEDIKKVASLDDARIALKERRLETLMDSAGFSETKKRRHLRELKSVEDFIVSKLPTYLDQFSSYTLMENERVYLSTLFESGLIKVPTSKETVEATENNAYESGDDESGIPMIDLGDELSDPIVDLDSCIEDRQPSKVEGNASDDSDELSYLDKIKDKLSAMKPNTQDEDEVEDSIEDMLVKNGSKKKGYIFNPIVIGFIALGFLSWFFMLQGDGGDTKSIIEQKAAQEQEKAFLPAVKVHTK